MNLNTNISYTILQHFSVFGVDTVSLEDLYASSTQSDSVNSTEKMEVSPFVEITAANGMKTPSIIFPKFNNYPIREDFENHLAEAIIPFNVAGIKDLDGKFSMYIKQASLMLM